MRIHENEIVSNGASWPLKEVQGPRQQRELQFISLCIISQATTQFGFSKITLEDYVLIYKAISKNIYAISKDELLDITKLALQKYIPGSKLTKSYIQLKHPVEVKVVSSNFEKIHNMVTEEVDAIWGFYFPTFLREGSSSESLRSQSVGSTSRFLTTSGIHNITEINDCIDELLANAHDILWIMLSYYEDEIFRFKRLLAKSIINRDIDFRIIYRDDPQGKYNTGCRKLIEELREVFGTYTKFEARAFNYRMLNPLKLPMDFSLEKISQFRGRMHAKMIITEKHLLVTSANLLGTSLKHNIEVGILTHDPICHQRGIEFFEEVWQCLKRQY